MKHLKLGELYFFLILCNFLVKDPLLDLPSLLAFIFLPGIIRCATLPGQEEDQSSAHILLPFIHLFFYAELSKEGEKLTSVSQVGCPEPLSQLQLQRVGADAL